MNKPSTVAPGITGTVIKYSDQMVVMVVAIAGQMMLMVVAIAGKMMLMVVAIAGQMVVMMVMVVAIAPHTSFPQMLQTFRMNY